MSVSPVWALNFECRDLECLFLVCMYVFGISRSSSYIEVIGLRPQEQKSMRICAICDWSAFD